MIVRIARVKVGNRQAPHARTPAQHGGGFAFTGPAAPRLRPSPHSAHLPSPRRARFPQSLARRSALGAETLRSTASLRFAPRLSLPLL